MTWKPVIRLSLRHQHPLLPLALLIRRRTVDRFWIRAAATVRGRDEAGVAAAGRSPPLRS